MLRTTTSTTVGSALRAACATTSRRPLFAAPFHTSRAARDSAGAGSHGHHEGAAGGPYTPSDFSAPIWRRAAVLLVAGVAFYKFNQSFGLDETDEDRRPWLTRYLAYNQPPRQVWIDHEEKHLELARDRAATKLFLQDAEHPPIQRLRANALNALDGSHARQPVGA